MFKIVFLVCQTFTGICYSVETEGYATEAHCQEAANIIIDINEIREKAGEKLAEDAVYLCIKSGQPA